jgi:hypothetical protein
VILDFQMAQHKLLNEAEIADLLFDEDDDGLDNISVDDDDGDDDGPQETEEVFFAGQPPVLTPPPPTPLPLSPGSQDMFDELPSPTASPSREPNSSVFGKEPPAKRPRMQQPNSGSWFPCLQCNWRCCFKLQYSINNPHTNYRNFRRKVCFL